MEPDGTDVRQLTQFLPDHIATDASWSPDGSTIVFQRTNARGRHHQIWTMNADGSDQRHLFADPWFEDHTPSFSPDGRTIVFSRCQPEGRDREHRCAVTTVDADGTNMRALTTPAPEEKVFWPVYSPDGRLIAFSVFYGRGVIAGVFVMNADGSDVRLVTPPKLGAWIPSWAPDGSRLVFSSHCCDGKGQASWSVRPDGTGLKEIVDPKDRHDFQPVYSPDGSHIAFERDRADYSRWGLYVMNTDGTGVTRLIPWGWQPAWQPVP
jgi:TolB protein